MDWDKQFLPYRQAADELHAKFTNISHQFGKLYNSSPIYAVEARVKTVSSILAKAQRKKIPPQDILEFVYDIAGIRIICRFVDDIEQIVDHIRARDDMEIFDDRDYVTKQKSSGYRGRHLIIRYPVVTLLGSTHVLCEIQIRTMAMNMWAVTEHSLRYKYNGLIPENIHRRLIRTAEAAYVLDSDTNIIRDHILEAEEDIKSREDIIFFITNTIEDLYEVADGAEVGGLYDKFTDILDKNDDAGLEAFYHEIASIAQAYRIR